MPRCYDRRCVCVRMPGVCKVLREAKALQACTVTTVKVSHLLPCPVCFSTLCPALICLVLPWPALMSVSPGPVHLPIALLCSSLPCYTLP